MAVTQCVLQQSTLVKVASQVHYPMNIIQASPMTTCVTSAMELVPVTVEEMHLKTSMAILVITVKSIYHYP